MTEPRYRLPLPDRRFLYWLHRVPWWQRIWYDVRAFFGRPFDG